jgi:hypothetical protein
MPRRGNRDVFATCSRRAIELVADALLELRRLAEKGVEEQTPRFADLFFFLAHKFATHVGLSVPAYLGA